MVGYASIRKGLMAAVTILICLFVCGCTPAPLLSQREIVHAVFFQRKGREDQVLLLLADSTQTAEGQDPAYRTVLGSGQTPAQALERAESRLDGEVFYGLMDLAVLSATYGWQEVTETARLLYGRTKPAPQILLLMMEEMPEDELQDSAAGLYRKMEEGRDRYGLKNGLQLIFSQQKECALPIWQSTGYGFVFLQQEQENLELENSLSAQLAVVLAGQADCLDCSFAEGNADLQAQAFVQHKVEYPGQNELHLTLSNPDMQDLSGKQPNQDDLAQTLCKELQQAFAGFVPELYTDTFDPLRIRTWVAAAAGPQATVPIPQLVVHLEV